MTENIADRPEAGTNHGKGKEASINGRFRRRAALASAGALCAGGLMLGFAATASASSFETVQGSVGVYHNTSLGSGKIGIPDLAPGDQIIVNCWGRGQDVKNGNVWYHVTAEVYTHLSGATANVSGWVYGGITDDNEAFHRGDFPAC